MARPADALHLQENFPHGLRYRFYCDTPGFLAARWARVVLSDQCRLETRDYDSDWIFGDTSTLWVPSVGNPPRTDQRVRVSRRNVQLTAAGLPVSQLSVSLRRSVEPIIAQ